MSAARQRVLEFIAWRQSAEVFSVAVGGRCVLEHVEENDWFGHFARGERPEDAVTFEMQRISD